MDLNTRTKNITLIISLKNDVFNDIQLTDYLNNNFEYWVWILHDLDTKLNDNGIQELKIKHIHIVGTLKKSASGAYPRLKKILNDCCEYLSININAITINKVNDLVSNIRYLLHLDSPSKHLYDVQQLKSNDNELTLGYLESVSDVLTTDILYDIIIGADFDLYKIMCRIGLDRYKKYRFVIQDIVKTKMTSLR